MKKLIAAIVIASIGAAFADPYYVYDYKASIKRLDISAKYINFDGSKVVAQKYSVKSDTISGYVTIPVCFDCTGTIRTSIDVLDANAFAYLTMKGNTAVKNSIYYVLKTPVKVSMGVFGADQIVSDTRNYVRGTIVDERKLNKAWMALDFTLPTERYTYGQLEAKRDVSAPVPLSFAGLTNNGATLDRYDVQNTGFGTAKNQNTLNFCGGSSNCLSVLSINGTLVGYPTYLGACEQTPMWDLCSLNQINEAVISGSWSLKFNKSMTDAYSTAATIADAEKVILAKFFKKPADYSYTEITSQGKVITK